MQRIFFINIIITMLLDNEFTSAEQHTHLHLRNIITQQHSPHTQIVQCYAHTSLNSVLTLIESGKCYISQTSKKVQDLMDKQQKQLSQLQKEEKRRKMEEKQIKNRLLYSKNKNKQIQTQQIQHYGVLSNTQHLQFINQMKHQSSLRRLNRQKLQQQKESQFESKLSTEKQLTQVSRLLQLQKKKEAIKQSLKKMRDNHEFFIRQEQQSKKIFNKIKRKKRLYEQMKESYDEMAFELINQRQQKAKTDRRELNKLDLSEIKMHEQEYEDWKKKQQKQVENRQTNDLSVEVPPLYQPPPHSEKIAHFLSQELKKRNKVEISKRMATEKLHRIAQYTSIVRQKFKPKSPPSKTEPTEKDKSSASQNLQNKKSITQLGNEYLRQAKLIIRKRAKTQERSLNPQKIDSSRSKNKSRTATLNYISETKRKEHIEKMKREEIENILKRDCADQAERLRRLKLADEKLSKQLKKKENEMKIRYTQETNENTLALLLSTIRAKINLIDSYRTKQ